jgi:RNA polymerase sigma-70 factor (ECF subfamily)
MEDRFDAQLIKDYLKGDKKSLEILIQRYLKPIYSFVYRYTGEANEAEDITQEVFVRVWQNLKKFSPRKNRSYGKNLRGEQGGSFKTWIFSIAKNASIDFFRKSRSVFGGKKSVPFSEFENEAGGNALIDRLIDPAPLAPELLERTGAGYILASVLDKLSPKYRMVLFLRYNDHFTFREIADSLGEPLHTIKSRHRRALILLRKLLAESSAITEQL